MSGSSAVAAVPRAARELLQSDLGGCLNPVGKVLRTLEDTAKRVRDCVCICVYMPSP